MCKKKENVYFINASVNNSHVINSKYVGGSPQQPLSRGTGNRLASRVIESKNFSQYRAVNIFHECALYRNNSDSLIT